MNAKVNELEGCGLKIPKKHICLVVLMDDSQGFLSGTMEIARIHAEILMESGYIVSAIFPRNNFFEEVMRKYSSRIHYIHPTNGKSAFGKNFLTAFHAFRSLKPDCVLFHCPSYRWGIDVILASELAGVPVILRMEHNPLLSIPEVYVRLLLHFADTKIKKFIYVSEGNLQRFEQLLPYRKGRGKVIFNCIELAYLDQLSSDPTTRVSLRNEFELPIDAKIALFSAGKWGIYDNDYRRPIFPVLKAFQQLLNDSNKAKEAIHWRLLIAGKGDDRAVELSSHMGLSTYVRFIGLRSDLLRLMKHCDLLVSASHYEGASITNLEAWALGIPVLSTQVDGISDIIGEGNFRRYMVPQGDVESFAQAWYEFMIGEPNRLAVHRKSSKIVRSEYSTKNMKPRLMEFYREILATR